MMKTAELGQESSTSQHSQVTEVILEDDSL